MLEDTGGLLRERVTETERIDCAMMIELEPREPRPQF